MDFFKKNKIIVGIIAVILLALVGGGYFVMNQMGNTAEEPIGIEEENAKPIKAEDVGLTLELTEDLTNVEMKLTKLDGVDSIEYNMSWDAFEKSEEGEGIVSKGSATTDPVSVKGKSEYEQTIRLGTCSARKCRDDDVRSDITLELKVNYSNGEVGALTETLEYPQE